MLSILVIDDDETVRGALVEFFETFGHTARGAATASQGRQLAAEHAPDVVLLDLRLPDANGIVAPMRSWPTTRSSASSCSRGTPTWPRR